MKHAKQAAAILVSLVIIYISFAPCIEAYGFQSPKNISFAKDSAQQGAKETVSSVALHKISALERTCAQDLATPPRGIGPLADKVKGSLLDAARSLADTPRPSVAIITGFWIIEKVVTRPDGTVETRGNASETDGPVGTAHLASGLARAGIPVRVVTDSPNEGAVRAALEEAVRGSGLTVPVEVVMWEMPGPSGPSPDLLAKNTASSRDTITRMAGRWKSEKVTHVIALERVGPAHSDGRPHTMGGIDVEAYAAPLHLLYEAGSWKKLAVGDGGNEIGMGIIDRELIRRSITNGKGGIIASKTSADYLQVCGVSNWGGPAFLFALAVLRPDIAEQLLSGLTPEKDMAVLKAAVEKGSAVDGIRGTGELSVDNMDWEKHAELLRQLWGAYNSIGGQVVH